MTTQWLARPAACGDMGQILSLVRLNPFDNVAPILSREFWQWKHMQSPFGASPILVAESQGRIIGVRVFLRWAWQAGNRVVRAVRAVDTATHPDWRGHDIFSQLTLRLVEQMRTEGITFVFNTPNQDSRAGYLKMGWSQVTRIPVWVHALRPLRLLRSLFSGTWQDDNPSLGDQGGSVAALLEDPRTGALLAQQQLPDTRYYTARTLDYLRWRYLAIPNFHYQARSLWEDEAGAAVIFLSKERRGLRELSLSEILLSPGEAGLRVGRQLLRDVASEAQADYMVACSAQKTPEAAALTANGFMAIPGLGPHFTALPLNRCGEVSNPFLWENWRCSIGDLEIF